MSILTHECSVESIAKRGTSALGNVHHIPQTMSRSLSAVADALTVQYNAFV